MTAVSDPAPAAPSIPLDPPRPSEEHVSGCDWCWSYWERTLAAERWMPSGERPRVIGDGPPCPHCDRTAYQIRRFLRGKAPQRLELAICFGCGHVRGLTEGRSPDVRDAAPPAAAAEEAPASEAAGVVETAREADVEPLASAAPASPHSPAAHVANGSADSGRFVRYPAVPRTGPASDEQADEEDEGEGGFRSLEPWEVAVFLAWLILALVILNAWIWWQRARDSGLF